VRSSSRDFVGIFPKFLHKHFLKMAFMLGGSFVVFHFLVFPLWFTLVGPMIKGQGGSLKEDNFTHEFSALVTISHTAALVIGLVFAKNSPSSQNLKHLWRDVREGGGGGGSGATVLFSLAVFGGLACVE
ncbi:hypothetical protein TrRE_jg546, partial [Triparma retinervis]